MNIVETQTQAKQFFVEKVIAEAKRQGASLSEAEGKMLYWSESDPQFDAKPDLVAQLEREISDTEYEAKIGQLLDAAYQREVQTDPSIRNQYRRAYSLLKQADHYIIVMIDRGLARRLRPWWKFSLS